MATKTQKAPAALIDNLHAAMAVELTTIPTYLYAYWSIKTPEQGGSPFGALAARLILSVITEEMLHLGLVANLLNALGAKPVLNRPHFIPKYPAPILRHSTGKYGFEVGLLRFSNAALNTFLEIELPSWKIVGTSGESAERGWDTIGEFYAAVEKQLTANLDYSYGNQLADFNNPGLGRMIQVSSQRTAKNALELIVDQGEGYNQQESDDENELSHYQKFLNIQQWIAEGNINIVNDVHQVIDNPFSEAYNSAQEEANLLFNSTYSELLDVLQQAFVDGDSSIFGRPTGLMVALNQQAAALRQTGFVTGTPFLAGPTFEYIPKKQRIS